MSSPNARRLAGFAGSRREVWRSTLIVALALCAATACATRTEDSASGNSTGSDSSGTAFSLPRGTGNTFRLPPGSTVKFMLEGRTHMAVVTVEFDALGFGLDQARPVDEAAAVTLLRGALTAAGRPYELRLAQRVEVFGYASAEGTPQHNLELSQRRADWVCGEVARLGAAHLTCQGRGVSDFPPSGPGPEDRRVEIRVVATTG
ncbi:hypothetical protein IMCC26256_111815 [Actinobacteria bacterium IMCC26256]|nr:hypothetical protein IMCC26256_111815 [Actinobacteria bacterium IMCC26256]